MNASASVNTVWHHATVARQRREKLNGHKFCVLWFTGLSGASKSTLAHAGEIKNYPGIDAPYEALVKLELIVDTGSVPLEVCVAQVSGFLNARGILV